MTSVLRTKALAKFSCLGDKCSDNCCSDVWTVDVDEATVERYRKEAPELLDAVEKKGDGWLMRKDKMHSCVKLQGGFCSIHNQYGDRMLSETCHFFPRHFTQLGDETIVTASPACPEITRLALEDAQACFFESAEMERMPATRSTSSPDTNSEQALNVHKVFLEATMDNDASVERIFARIAHTARALAESAPPLDEMAEEAKLFLKQSDAELPVPVPNPADPFNLLHALFGIVVDLRSASDHSRKVITDMETAMGVKLDWKTRRIHADMNSQITYQLARNSWQNTWRKEYEVQLRRWLALQLSHALFPFPRKGRKPMEVATFIGVRLATVKLALMCACSVRGEILPLEETVRLFTSISRITDHLDKPEYSATIYAEPKWDDEARMLGLLNFQP